MNKPIESNSITFTIAQLDDSGHRILQESIGTHWNMEAVFRPDIFRIFPMDSCKFPVLSGRNRPFPRAGVRPR